jgi:hypothetical protein
MGLTITNEIYTDSGVTGQLYLNITRIDLIKDSTLQVHCQLYLNRESRDLDPTAQVFTKQVNRLFRFKYGAVTSDLFEIPVHAAVYSKIKSELEESGHIVLNEI